MCELCNVSQTDKLFETADFFGLQCRKCDVPMVVSRFHVSSLPPVDLRKADKLAKEQFGPSYKPRGIGMRSNPDHWHEHYLPRGIGEGVIGGGKAGKEGGRYPAGYVASAIRVEVDLPTGKCVSVITDPNISVTVDSKSLGVDV